MSSFTSYIPGYQQPNEHPNAGRSRPTTGLGANNDDFALRRRENPMFFTNDDDGDSIFGSDELVIIDHVDSAPRQYNAVSTSSQGPRSQKPRADGSRANANSLHNASHRSSRLTSGNLQQTDTFKKALPIVARSDVDTIEIKEEVENERSAEADFLNSVPASERVRIFVGRRNRAVHVRRSELVKSPMLLSYIIDDPIQGAFIMRPQLMSTHVDDFEAISQYLRSGEYSPTIQANPTDPNGPKILEGFKSDEQYAKELVRCGKLSILARYFNVEGMPELIFRKVSEVDAGKFNIFSLVRVAEIVFKNSRESSRSEPTNANGIGDVLNVAGSTHKGDVTQNDPLEEWIIGKLAHNFQEIMRTRSEKFWEVAKSTSKKMLFARVLEEVADRYRATGGKLPEPVIELD